MRQSRKPIIAAHGTCCTPIEHERPRLAAGPFSRGWGQRWCRRHVTLELLQRGLESCDLLQQSWIAF